MTRAARCTVTLRLRLGLSFSHCCDAVAPRLPRQRGDRRLDDAEVLLVLEFDLVPGRVAEQHREPAGPARVRVDVVPRRRRRGRCPGTPGASGRSRTRRGAARLRSRGRRERGRSLLLQRPEDAVDDRGRRVLGLRQTNAAHQALAMSSLALSVGRLRPVAGRRRPAGGRRAASRPGAWVIRARSAASSVLDWEKMTSSLNSSNLAGIGGRVRVRLSDAANLCVAPRLGRRASTGLNAASGMPRR